MLPELVWQVWYTHSQCAFGDCPDAGETSSVEVIYPTWAEAAADIERRLLARPDGCEMDAIVDHVIDNRQEEAHDDAA